MPHKKAIWRKSVELEREYGSKLSLKELLTKAIGNERSKHAFLFIELAKVLLSESSVEPAIQVLQDGLSVHPGDESIAISLQETLRSCGLYERATQFLTGLTNPTARLKMQHV